MTDQELLRAIAYLIALDRQSVANDAARLLPPWFEVVDVIRAGDGIENLARALDTLRRVAPEPGLTKGHTLAS